MKNVDLEAGGSGENVDVSQQSEESNCNLSHGVYNPEVKHDLKPRKGQEFQTLDHVKLFYNAYAKEAGFSIRSWSSRKRKGNDEILRKEYCCHKQGKSPSEKKRFRGTSKEDCNARLAVVKSDVGTYVVTVFIEGHSHLLSPPQLTHLLRSHRSVSTSKKSLTPQKISVADIPPHQQSRVIGDKLREYFRLEQSKNPSFAFKIEMDDERKITQCFWADATSRQAYKFFGDVVIFDTTYDTNPYGLIFAQLMGINNHGQTIIFACGFLGDATEDSFVWLFSHFLEVMPGDAPKTIITDQDPAITKAISQTLSSTFHMYCAGHVFSKFAKEIDLVKYIKYSDEFSDCIWTSETKEEFDSRWTELVDKSGCKDNKWLRSVYEIRSRWVPAYVNHIFSAEMSSYRQAESAHTSFEKYRGKNNSLVDFVIQFGKGIAHQRHEELMADKKDLTEKPEVKLLHDFLVQMADIYTHEIFFKFQEELWGSLNYKFELVKETDNHQVFKVIKKNVEKCRGRELCYEKKMGFASCSCQKFESLGIPCRHILAYLHKKHDFDKLPDQYIVKRWTKYAKCGKPCGTTVGDGGMVTTDAKSYLMKRRRLIQFSLDAVEIALTNEEATKVFTNAIGSALEKIDQMVDCATCKEVSGEKNNQMEVSRKMSCTCEYSYNEHSSKACGKIPKGGTEEAVGTAQKDRERPFHGYGEVDQSHVKSKSLKFKNLSSIRDKNATSDDDSSSSTDK